MLLWYVELHLHIHYHKLWPNTYTFGHLPACSTETISFWVELLCCHKDDCAVLSLIWFMKNLMWQKDSQKYT